MSDGGVFIRLRGLPWHVTPQEILDFLEGVNVVGGEKGVRMVTSRYDGKSTGECFVELESEQDEEQAFKHDKENLGHRYIEIFSATQDEAEFATRKPGNSNVVKLRGLPYSVDELTIEDFFRGLAIKADREGIVIVMDRRGRASGEAYVQFETEEDTENALKLNREKIGHRYIEIFRSTIGELKRASNTGRPGPYDRSGRGGGGRGNDDNFNSRGGNNRNNRSRGGGDNFGNNFGGRGGSGGGFNNSGGGGGFNNSGFGGGGGGNFNNGGGFGGGGNSGGGRFNNNNGFGNFGNNRNNDFDDSNDGGNFGNNFSNRNNMGGGGGGGGSSSGGGNFGNSFFGGNSGGGNSRMSNFGGGGDDDGGNNDDLYVVRMRGLPYYCYENDVKDFFEPVRPVDVKIKYNNKGLHSGTAEAYFETEDDAEDAMKKDREQMGSRYIELFFDGKAKSGGGGGGFRRL